MRIAVCDDQAEVLTTAERMFRQGITGIENVDIYQDIRKLKKEFQSTSPLMASMRDIL